MSILYDYICRTQILSIIEDVRDRKAVSINLAWMDIEHLPELFYECDTVLRVFLHRNKLVDIGPAILRLSHITMLTLDYNALTTLPDEIRHLTNLQTLNISHNPLKKINQICELKKLEVLWCNSIDMERIPEEIGQLKELDTFGARGNKIRQLPKSFLQLTKLTWLSLENNLLNKLPYDMNRLRSLVHLNLKNNELKSLPISLSKCRNLLYVFVRSNQINIVNLQHVMKISKIKHLVYIDARDNPFMECTNLKDKLLKYPKVKVDDSWAPSSTDTTDTPSEGETQQEQDVGNASNDTLLSPETTDDADDAVYANELELYDESDLSSIGSDDDWEHSYPSSQLDSTDHEEDPEENEAIGLFLPELSRFIGTGS